MFDFSHRHVQVSAWAPTFLVLNFFNHKSLYFFTTKSRVQLKDFKKRVFVCLFLVDKLVVSLRGVHHRLFCEKTSISFELCAVFLLDELFNAEKLHYVIFAQCPAISILQNILKC